jgi:predicted molibdopterin-dependent oxidoreductase YjgC
VISAVDKGAKLAVISSMKLLIAKLANTSVVFDPDKMRKFVKKLCSVSGDISQSTGSKGEAEVIYSKFKAAKMPVVIVGEDVFKGHFSGEDLRMILTAFKSRVFPVFNLNNVLGAVSYGLTPCADVSYLEKVWNTELPKSKGMNILEIIKAASEGSIKCLYVTGENIAVSAGNSDRVTEALNKVDFLVVQELFMTETALLADLILPAASSIEKSGTFTNTEGRIREVNEIRKPIANTKTDFAIFTEIIDKMGGTALYKKPEDAAKDLPRLNFLKQKKYICNVNDISVQEAADEKYPLWLKTDNSRIMFHTGSLLRNSEMLTREMIKQAVLINSDYAKKNSFRSGEKVRIVSRTGSLERPLLLLPELPEETLVFRTNITDASYSGLMPLGCKWTTVRLEKIK